MENEKLKKIQKTELEILKLIDQVCRENDIKYSLAFGSALGAIRHKGFIPWDDDADIVMEYSQYQKFAKVCWKYFGDKYFLQDADTEKETPFVFSKVRKNGTVMLDGLADDLAINQGIWVDIFILIDPCTSKFGYKIQCLLIEVYQMLRCKYIYLHSPKRRGLNPIKEIIFHLPDGLFNSMEKLIYGVIRKMGSQKAENYYCISNDGHDRSLVKKKWFNNLEYHEFEDARLLVPHDYDEMLSAYYGDYMTPVRYSGHADYSSLVV